MNDVIFEAIVAILGADIALLVAYLAYISPKHEPNRLERKNLLNEKLNSEINKRKSEGITMESILPLFEEYETIEKWGKVLKQVCQYLGYSIFLALVGLIFCVFDSVTIENIPVSALFIIVGGIYFLLGLYTIISHAIEVNEWKVSKKS